MKDEIKLLYIDLFCGAGGTSTGIELAKLHGEKCAKVVACVNHDPMAIASHLANHPEAMHFTEDIRTLELSPLVTQLDKFKGLYPAAHVVLWASLECTNFSKAKGGQPRDADSRTLADHLFRYIEALNPDYIQIENVVEFMSWGALDENGKPVSKLNGTDYMRWVKQVSSYGYNFDWRELNAADFGAYTSRKRYFGQFARTGLPLVFPQQTYAKNGGTVPGELFPSQYKKWKAVKDVLDFSDDGKSIFERPKPLKENTLKRIYAGLIKFVAGGEQAFLVKYNSMNQQGHYTPPSLDDPCPTVAVQQRIGLAKCHFLSKQFSGDPSSKNTSIEDPAGTVTCIDHHALITYYGNGGAVSIEEPSPTIPTHDRVAKVTFITNDYSGGGQLGSVEDVSPAILTTPKQRLVTAEKRPWVMNTNFHNVGSSVEDPSPVITANRKYHYLVNPQFNSKGGSVENPCFTLIARMDKMPPYLVCTEQGVAIEVYEDDTPMTRKIKEFMAVYGITDIKMRMLKIPELKAIMGFPKDYVLKGTQSEQKKFIGNAVEVNMSRCLCEALAERLVGVA